MGKTEKWRAAMFLTILLSGCSISDQDDPEQKNIYEETRQHSSDMESVRKEDQSAADVWEKGYQLPLEHAAKEDAETDCKRAMEKISTIYIEADKGETFNPVLNEEAISEMYISLQETGCPVISVTSHYTMGNYEKMESFLIDCLNKKESSVTLYKIFQSGGINRSQFEFDGTDMYVIDTVAMWNEENNPFISNTSYTRIKDWDYTEKGWFSYEYCVPEYPEVTETVNGNNLLRVKPMPEEYIRMAEDYLLPIGYQGNNLLRSNWDESHLEELDYNGLYEYLYFLKSGDRVGLETYPDGIPKAEFENLIMEYLPVTTEKLARYAVFDEEKQVYIWKRLGQLTYRANLFSTSIPEVTKIVDNPDGTRSVSIDAVCPLSGEDSVMSHVLKIRIQDEGSIEYLSNQILGNGLEQIPEYRYRLSQYD